MVGKFGHQRRVALIGLGLIGGSLACALKEHTAYTVAGYDAGPGVSTAALAAGAIDLAVPTLEEAVREADIIFFCLPVRSIVTAIGEAAPFLKAGAIVTDVASTKGYLLDVIPALLPEGVVYVGGHPMAGSEKSGFAAAQSGLFVGKPYVLSHQGNNETALEQLKELITAIGAIPLVLDGAIHDRAVAEISHIPHIMAAALATLAGTGHGKEHNRVLAATGFRDMTRIAGSDSDMWVDICLTNRHCLEAGLTQMIDLLNDFRDKLGYQDEAALREFFANGKLSRQFMAQ